MTRPGGEESTAPHAPPVLAAVRSAPVPRRVPIAGVPRSFSAGRMLAIVALFAVLFSLLQITGAPVALFPYAGVFCAAVILGQMLLFGGRHPRAASCIVGAAAMPILSVFALLSSSSRGLSPFENLLVCTTFSGAIAGYLVGAICAGAFLVLDRRWDAGRILTGSPFAAPIPPEGATGREKTPDREDPGGGNPWGDG